MGHRRPPRLTADCYRGPRRIFVTMCCFRRFETFADAGRATSVRDELLRTCSANDIEILAYCLMPDHLHALFEGRSSNSDVAAIVALSPADGISVPRIRRESIVAGGLLRSRATAGRRQSCNRPIHHRQPGSRRALPKCQRLPVFRIESLLTRRAHRIDAVTCWLIRSAEASRYGLPRGARTRLHPRTRGRSAARPNHHDGDPRSADRPVSPRA